jgi:hypothetical protein
MPDLHQMKFVACRAGESTLTDAEIRVLQPQISEWQVREVNGEKRLSGLRKNDFIMAAKTDQLFEMDSV